ncbi:MAG: nucleotidyltransferase [Acidobacteria bacterium]|nr:nucleotidyltransferase [Acidobacteriota bacterium]MBS1867756.1 nucleotidyltransferase [Acidobacteriota bacterium]
MSSAPRLSPITLQSLLSAVTPAASPAPRATIGRWIAVRPRFEQFNLDLMLTPAQQRDGKTKAGGVLASLKRHYYGEGSQAKPGILVGSWGKETAGRPPRDVDMYFELPSDVYYRFERNLGNRQSALLQEVKNVISETYPSTEMRGDGQVVVVGFDSYNVEVVPAFALTNDRYWICDTNNGGSYKEADPWAEMKHIETVDHANAGNLRPLIRMAKAWQDSCSVPIKSFQLELVAADFIQQSPWRLRDFFWFDWITRDFFAYLYHRANTFITVPGTLERIYLSNEWQSRAESAYWRAAKACDFEWDNMVVHAGDEWQKVFGQQIPRTV